MSLDSEPLAIVIPDVIGCRLHGRLVDLDAGARGLDLSQRGLVGSLVCVALLRGNGLACPDVGS